MQRVIVKVKRNNESRVNELKVPAGVNTIRLAKLIADTLGWSSDESGHPITYTIESSQLGRILQPEETLESAGVMDGSRLVLHPVTTEPPAEVPQAEDDPWLQMFMSSAPSSDVPQAVEDSQPTGTTTSPSTSDTPSAGEDDPWLRMFMATPSTTASAPETPPIESVAAQSVVHETIPDEVPSLVVEPPPVPTQLQPAEEPSENLSAPTITVAADEELIAYEATAAPVNQVEPIAESGMIEAATTMSEPEPHQIAPASAPAQQPTQQALEPPIPAQPQKGPVKGWRKIMDLPDAQGGSKDQPEDKPHNP